MTRRGMSRQGLTRRFVKGVPDGEILPDCIVCGIWPALRSSPRCRTCQRYFRRHGVERPAKLIERERSTARAADPQAVLQRFAAKVEVTGGCWLWIGARTRTGYGNFNAGAGRTVLAHRFAYEVRFGPIGRGLVVDHLCSHPSCVNPDHLEAVTYEENAERSRDRRKVLAEMTGL